MPFSSVLCCCPDGRRGHIFLGSVPLGVAQLFPLENPRKKQKAEVSGQCCGMGPLPLCPFLPYCRAPQGVREGGIWAVMLPRLPGKFLLGSHDPFLSSRLAPRCLQPWLMVFPVSFCPLFTLFNVTAVHATQAETGHVWRLRVTAQPCLLSQASDTGFPTPLFLLTQGRG